MLTTHLPLVFSLVGFAQGASVCAFLLAGRQRRHSWNGALTGAIALLSLRQLLFAAAYEDWLASGRVSAAAGTMSLFLLWPFLATYVRHMRTGLRDGSWFLASSIVMVIAAALLVVTYPGAWYPFPAATGGMSDLAAAVCGAVALPACAGAAVAWAWVARPGDRTPSSARTRVNWLRSFTALAALIPATTVLTVISGALAPALAASMALLELAAEVAVLEFVALVAMANGRIFRIPPARQERLARTPAAAAPPASAVTERLLLLMETRRPYRNPDLRIADLAGALQVPAHVLSGVINSEFETNFFDFVNEYRVSDACRLLRDPDRRQFTIISIALEVGFASKTAFNRAFKQHVGVTPSEYQRRESGKVRRLHGHDDAPHARRTHPM